MAVRYSESDYAYVSARVRAMEVGLIGKERIGALLEMKTADEVLEALFSAGFPRVTREDGSVDDEAVLAAVMREGISVLSPLMPDPSLLFTLQYPYDCHNIKAIIKCRAAGVDTRSMLIDMGSVPTARLLDRVAEGDYGVLPTHMGEAVPALLAAYARNKDPREIDLALDRACFLDLADAARGFAFAERLVRANADLSNIKTCLRLLRMSNTYLAELLFARAFVPGGTLEERFFTEAFASGESRLADLLVTTPYSRVLLTEGQRTLAKVERNADDHLMGELARVRYTPYGAEVPLAYLMGLQTSLKNLRILLNGKRAGLDRDALCERVRESYV